MSRKRKITNFEDEIIQEAQVVTRFSPVRIIVAIILFVVIVGAVIVGIKYFINNSKTVLGSNTTDKPLLKVPDESRVQKIIEKAKQDLSDINPKNIVESQPQILKIIQDLQNISTSSNSAKTLICDTLCK